MLTANILFLRFRGWFNLITVKAVQHLPDSRLPAGFMENPGPVFKWGIVADVLPVPAFQSGDPIAIFVGVEADDFSLHAPE